MLTAVCAARPRKVRSGLDNDWMHHFCYNGRKTRGGEV